MKKRIIVLLWAVLFTVSGLALSEYFRLGKMSQMERKLIITQASLLLDDQLLLELKRSAMDRYDLIKREGLLSKREGHGGVFDDKTMTVYTAFPEPQKRTWQFETEDEWYEHAKEKYGMYHISGINLARLDSLFGDALQSKGITLPYILAIRDSSGTILEQIPADDDCNGYQLVTDSIQLDFDRNNFLVACFDKSHFGMFRQSRNMMLFSFGIALLVITFLLYLLYTIFSQMKIAFEKEEAAINIVHDLKGPVVYIKEALQIINTDSVSQKYVQEMAYINEQLSLMIEKMLTVSSVEEKQLVQKEPVFLYGYLHDMISKHQANNEHVDISFCCDDASLIAAIDRFHFGNAVNNLIENAIKYSGSHPIISVSCFKEGSILYISIKDNGAGIPKQYISHLFKKHYRTPEQTSSGIKGFGLGLYYVKIISQKHGGDVFVKSEPGKGSEFIIHIPTS